MKRMFLLKGVQEGSFFTPEKIENKKNYIKKTYEWQGRKIYINDYTPFGEQKKVLEVYFKSQTASDRYAFPIWIDIEKEITT